MSSSSSLATVQSLLTSLSACVSSSDVVLGSSLLDSIKLELLNFDSLPPQLLPTPTASSERYLAACALELGVLLAAKSSDMVTFDRHMSQLKPLYFSCPHETASCPHKRTVLGLNLLRLLSADRLADLHSDLESYPPDVRSSPEVTSPLLLERSLAVGSYDAVFDPKALSGPLAVLAGAFRSTLHATARLKIADAVEVSYAYVSREDLCDLLFFQGGEAGDKELEEYIAQCREDWKLEGGGVVFEHNREGARTEDVPTRNIIANNLRYATEIERIV